MEDETYLLEGEFAFKSYKPTKLKVGMHFLTQITVGILEPEWRYFTLEEIPEDENKFMSLYGAPVHIWIISTDEQMDGLAEPREIGLFFDGKDTLPITDDQINTILNQYDGIMDIECDEEGLILLFEGKVIISYLSNPENEEES